MLITHKQLNGLCLHETDFGGYTILSWWWQKLPMQCSHEAFTMQWKFFYNASTNVGVMKWLAKLMKSALDSLSL